MNLSNSLTQSAKVWMGLFVLSVGAIFVATPGLAQQQEIITDPKPLEIPTGTVQDLGGTESRTIVEGLGGVGGESPTPKERAASFKFEQSPHDTKTGAINSTLEQNDENLGDVQRPTYRVPFLHF